MGAKALDRDGEPSEPLSRGSNAWRAAPVEITRHKMKKDIFDLTGKIAIVSGASRGIGESAARLLANYGAHVVVSSRKIAGVTAVADAIHQEGGEATPLACHAGTLEATGELV